MTPLLPSHAVQFFGPDQTGDWGGVPWDRFEAAHVCDTMTLTQKPLGNVVAVYAKRAIILTGSVDDDTDGPGGGEDIDPCWQPGTALRWPDGPSIDSRQFRGMVMHHVVQQLGAGLGDLGAVCWNGVIHFVQYYDIGPYKKLQEGAEKILRDTGVIHPGQSSWHAAVVGNDVQDFCSLIFPGSAPKDVHGRPYALPQDEIIERGWTLWRALTGRSVA